MAAETETTSHDDDNKYDNIDDDDDDDNSDYNDNTHGDCCHKSTTAMITKMKPTW